jgi:serine/threonine-protein kinase
VRRDGARVRITARLVDVSSGQRIWSQSYERELTDVFRIQDDVATSVADALRVNLTETRPAPAGARTAQTEAYQYHLLGRRLLSTPNPDAERRAMEIFEKALAIDPGYAPAWAGLAIALHQVEPRSAAEAADLRRRATEAAERGVALAPDLPEALASRGWLRIYALDWEGADRDLALAVKLGPGEALPHRSRAGLFYDLGRAAEAIAELKIAIALDPLATQSWANIGRVFISTGQLGEARRALERALEISPTQAYAIVSLTEVFLMSAEPRQALELANQIPWEPQRLAAVARAQHDLGLATESQKTMDALVKGSAATDPASIAAAYAWRGEKDAAFEWLERALQQSGFSWMGLKVDPVFRKLRGDPRWTALLRKMNLPPD